MATKEEFKSLVWAMAKEINANPNQIRIRLMKSKLGSCSPKKIITYDSSVLSLPENLQKEVIIHELLHLRYKNHGKLFKAVLKTYVEDLNDSRV